MRVVRCSSRAFSRSSSSDTFRLTVDFGIPSSAAAAVKLPACTTRANTSDFVEIHTAYCPMQWNSHSKI